MLEPGATDQNQMKRISLLALLLGSTQTACIAVGYSSRGGWFLWPGGLGLLVVVLLVVFLLRRGM